MTKIYKFTKYVEHNAVVFLAFTDFLGWTRHREKGPAINNVSYSEWTLMETYYFQIRKT